MSGSKEEMAAKGTLGVEVYAPVLEIGIELLLALPIVHAEGLQVVFVDIKQFVLLVGVEYLCFTDFLRLVQQAAAHQIDEPVGGHPRGVFGKEMGMFLDEGNDIVILAFGWLEAAEAVASDDELVAAHPAPVAVNADIRRIAQAVTAVQPITRVHQQFLYAQPSLVILVGQFCHDWFSILHSSLNHIPCLSSCCIRSVFTAAS